MIQFISQYRSHIETRLKQFLQAVDTPLNQWENDVRRRILEYSLRGKMIRGALVFGGAILQDAAADRQKLAALSNAAASMELIQSFLLVHDDIMDNDDIRRGGAAIHVQYRQVAEQLCWQDQTHTGVALAMCAGDIAAFWAMELLSEIDVPMPNYRHIQQMAAREISWVGMAQMQDVINGVQPSHPAINDVIDVYRFKTGRYTFSLPLMLGWLIAGGDAARIDLLGRLGEAMGVVFQIQDDYLGLFGNISETGKPTTSDIAENKQTLYRLILSEKLSGAKSDALLSVFGSNAVDEADVMKIRAACRDSGTLAAVDEIRKQYEQKCSRMIEELQLDNKDAVGQLHELLAYIGSRSM